MADLARENSLDADVSAPGKRDIEQTADAPLIIAPVHRVRVTSLHMCAQREKPLLVRSPALKPVWRCLLDEGPRADGDRQRAGEFWQAAVEVIT